MHTMLTSHHLVKNELETVRRGLTKLYDKAAISLSLCYFIGDIPICFGLPSRFWGNTHKASHLYHRHTLLAAHGRELWLASKSHLFKRGWKKWVVCIPVLHYIQLIWLFIVMSWRERGRKPYLAHLAIDANSQMWGISSDRLEAEMTTNVAFGNLREPKTVLGRMLRAGVIGYGGVERRSGKFTVISKAWNWPLVSHELTKGIAELVCLHGLNSLDDSTYFSITDEADQIEYEVWMMQAGGEMWRRFLSVIPDNLTIPGCSHACRSLRSKAFGAINDVGDRIS